MINTRRSIKVWLKNFTSLLTNHQINSTCDDVKGNVEHFSRGVSQVYLQSNFVHTIDLAGDILNFPRHHRKYDRLPPFISVDLRN